MNDIATARIEKSVSEIIKSVYGDSERSKANKIHLILVAEMQNIYCIGEINGIKKMSNAILDGKV